MLTKALITTIELLTGILVYIILLSIILIWRALLSILLTVEKLLRAFLIPTLAIYMPALSQYMKC
jgi:hypothetical protein